MQFKSTRVYAKTRSSHVAQTQNAGREAWQTRNEVANRAPTTTEINDVQDNESGEGEMREGCR